VGLREGREVGVRENEMLEEGIVGGMEKV